MGTRLNPKIKLSSQIVVRTTMEERIRAIQLAAVTKMTLSEWVRQLIRIECQKYGIK
jgi:hypothetical protein